MKYGRNQASFCSLRQITQSEYSHIQISLLRDTLDCGTIKVLYGYMGTPQTNIFARNGSSTLRAVVSLVVRDTLIKCFKVGSTPTPPTFSIQNVNAIVGHKANAATATHQQQHNKALHPTAYSFVRSSLRFRRRVSLSLKQEEKFVADNPNPTLTRSILARTLATALKFKGGTSPRLWFYPTPIC